MSPRSREPAGFSLVEVLVALALTSLLVSLLAGVLLAQLRLTRAVAKRAAVNDAVRTAHAVLAGEVRRASRADLRALAADSISLRNFRGAGAICGISGGAARVRYRGDRLPDPAKDSALLVWADSSRALALIDVRTPASTCAAPSDPDEVVIELRVDAVWPPNEGMLLVFESGSYYLTSRALRYRLGGEGRQPLTDELFRHPATRFDATSMDGGPRFRLASADGRVTELATGFAR